MYVDLTSRIVTHDVINKNTEIVCSSKKRKNHSEEPEVSQSKKKCQIIESDLTSSHSESETTPSRACDCTVTIQEENRTRIVKLQSIGTFHSNGHASGRKVYSGPFGGLFYMGYNGGRNYVDGKRMAGIVYDLNG